MIEAHYRSHFVSLVEPVEEERRYTLDELLGPVTGEDQRAACDVYMASDFGLVGKEDFRAYHRKVVEAVIANRRARLAPAKKERVTVGETSGHWIVYRDGEEVSYLSRTIYARIDAERYAAGLRAEIRKEPNDEN